METVELKPTNVGFMETLEEMISCSRSSADKRLKPHPEQSLNCPRCSSTNTKFCYYNNYSLSQPRYFCKTCRRYWTKGGALRNVPVGGGCRKNRRSIANKPETKPTLNGCSQIHPDLGTHGLSSSLSCFVMADGHDLVLPNTRTQQYCGYGNTSESELFEHKPFPFSSISSSLNGVGENVAGLQNSGSLLNHSMEGLNGYFNQQRIEGGRLFFPLEDHREAAKPNMFGGFDQKVVGQPSENSCYWNGFGETWPEFPNYFP